MTTLVTGGTGFLGRHICEKLRAEGTDVRVLTRNFDDELHAMGVEQIEGSLSNIEDINVALEGVDVVFHLAGLVERDPANAHRMYELHVEGTRRLLDALTSRKVKRVIVASTSGTVGVSEDSSFVANDHSPTAEMVVGRWPYYLSKIYAEHVCDRYIEKFDLPIIQLRPTLLLGPGDRRESSTGDVVRFLQEKIPSTLPGGLSFVDVRDTADAFLSARTNGEPGEKYLLGAANMTLEEFFAELERISGRPAPKFAMPYQAAKIGSKLMDQTMKLFGKRAAVDPVSVDMAGHFWYIDWSRAESVLGFKPRSATLTLRDTIRWIERHHPDFDAQPINEATPN